MKLFEDFLPTIRDRQKINRRLCGSCRGTENRDCIYVNEMGELIKPNDLTQAFPAFPENHGLRKIRFHDLRHTCAARLYANGVALKELQEWLGCSDIAATSNIYTHPDYSSRVASVKRNHGHFVPKRRAAGADATDSGASRKDLRKPGKRYGIS